MGIFSHNLWIVSRSIVLVVASAYLGLSALMYIFQSRLIYHPVRVITMTPKNIGLTYENATFKAEDKGIFFMRYMRKWIKERSDDEGLV